MQKVIVYHADDSWSSKLDGNLVEAIVFLTKILESIPEKYKASAVLDIEAYEDHDSNQTKTVISYERPYNSRELNAMKCEEERVLQVRREDYLRLKKEFEPN